jgi:hypothetical protein
MSSIVQNTILRNSDTTKYHRVSLEWCLFLVLSGLVVCGCSCSETTYPAIVSDLRYYDKTVQNNTTIYEHDFGLIRPGDEVSLRFEIVNSTDVPWTVQEIQTNCSCTVPTISTKIFQPDECRWGDVVYHAGKSNADDTRTIYVVCAEPGPTIPLRAYPNNTAVWLFMGDRVS